MVRFAFFYFIILWTDGAFTLCACLLTALRPPWSAVFAFDFFICFFTHSLSVVMMTMPAFFYYFSIFLCYLWNHLGTVVFWDSYCTCFSVLHTCTDGNFFLKGLNFFAFFLCPFFWIGVEKFSCKRKMWNFLCTNYRVICST